MSWFSLTRPLSSRGDHRVLDLDQIFALHVEHLVPHLLGLLFRIKRDENQVAHDDHFLSGVELASVRPLSQAPDGAS
jgi:hypothetical protein